MNELAAAYTSDSIVPVIGFILSVLWLIGNILGSANDDHRPKIK